MRECELQATHSKKIPTARVVTIYNRFQIQSSGKRNDTFQKMIQLMRESTNDLPLPLLLKSPAPGEQCHPEHKFGD
jgi:hypothetical protein